MAYDLRPLGNEFRWQVSNAQPEEILDLTGENDDRYPAGESDDNRVRNELDRRAQPGQAEYHQNHSSHQSGDDESVDAESLYYSVNYDDECSGRSTDLHSRATQRRNEKSGYNRRVESAIRSHTAGDS